jgi:hypothetical protein
LHGGDFTRQRHAVAHRFDGLDGRAERGTEQQ